MKGRTVLIKIDSVMYLTGESADAIYEKATGSCLFGGYKWVFNVATNPNGAERDLRFWAREILAPETTDPLSLDAAMRAILPMTRQQYHSGEVCNALLCIRRKGLMLLREQLNGRLGANSSFTPREGLENFLRARWLGAEAAIQKERSAA